MTQKNLNLFILAIVLILMGVASRLSAHAWNFTIMGGLSILCGAFFARKWVSVVVIFSSLFISDMVIGFHPQMPGVYLGFALMIFVGALLKAKPSRLAVTSGAALGSFLFFVVTNFFVWLEGSLYPQAWNGLIECYTMAIPFYRNQLVADLVSTLVLFEVVKAMKEFLAARLDQAEVNPLV